MHTLLNVDEHENNLNEIYMTVLPIFYASEKNS